MFRLNIIKFFSLVQQKENLTLFYCRRRSTDRNVGCVKFSICYVNLTNVTFNNISLHTQSFPTYLGTTTSKVCKYSDSETKSSFFTRSTRLLVIRFPLHYHGKSGRWYDNDQSYGQYFHPIKYYQAFTQTLGARCVI